MASIDCASDVGSALASSLRGFTVNDAPDGCYVATPFLDSSGDPILIRVRKRGDHYVIDDGGHISHSTEYVEPHTSASRNMNSMLRGLTNSFRGRLNEDEGTVEMSCAPDGVTKTLFRIVQLVVALDAAIGHLSVESSKQKHRQRPSLGPRVATRIAHRIKPVLTRELAQRNYTVDGRAVQDWQVDFYYELKRPGAAMKGAPSSVAIIAVDLAVRDPIAKASDALVRALDIKGAHLDYELRVALDTHDQDGLATPARKLLEEHHGDTFFVYDVSEDRVFGSFTSQIRSELGAYMFSSTAS